MTTAGYVGSMTVLLNTTATSNPPPPPGPPVKRTLSVAKSGAGAGSVSSAPGGIDCGATCSSSYDDGTNVTLSAAADAGSKFDGWSGDCSGTGACSVAMSTDRSVGASFSPAGRVAGDKPARLKRTTYKIAPAGSVTLLIVNPNNVKAAGSVRLAITKPGARRKVVTIGRAAFSAGAKSVAHVKVLLIKSVRVLLAKKHSQLSAKALLVLKPHGRALSVTEPVTLKSQH